MEDYDFSLEPNLISERSNSCYFEEKIQDPYTNFYGSPLWIVFWSAVFFVVEIFGEIYLH